MEVGTPRRGRQIIPHAAKKIESEDGTACRALSGVGSLGPFFPVWHTVQSDSDPFKFDVTQPTQTPIKKAQ